MVRSTAPSFCYTSRPPAARAALQAATFASQNHRRPVDPGAQLMAQRMEPVAPSEGGRLEVQLAGRVLRVASKVRLNLRAQLRITQSTRILLGGP